MDSEADRDEADFLGLDSVEDWSRRRRVLGGGVVTVCVALLLLLAFVPAPILGLVVHDEARFGSAPAAPSDDATASVGYEPTTDVELVVRQEISPAGQSRTLVVSNQRRSYEHVVQAQNESFTAGTFTVVTTPAIPVAGSAQNPVATMTEREILDEFGSEFGRVDGDNAFRRVGTRSAELVGQSVAVPVFETEVTVDGEQRTLAVYVATARANGDVVVAVGVHPRAFPDERVAIFELIDAVRHPAD